MWEVKVHLESVYNFVRRSYQASLILHDGVLYRVKAIVQIVGFEYDLTVETISYEGEETETRTIRRGIQDKIFTIKTEFVYRDYVDHNKDWS